MTNKQLIRYAAFLRGINVGGNTMIKMSELKKTFESLGAADVKTLLNSGNVIFSYEQIENSMLEQKIEEALSKTFGFSISVMVRTSAEITSLIRANPFKHVTVTPQIRLLVTFAGELPKSTIKLPYKSPEKDFCILCIIGHDICSVIDSSSTKGTPDAMKLLEREFGKKITTRTWNTVQKIAAI